MKRTILSLVLAALTIGAAAQSTDGRPVEKDTVQNAGNRVDAQFPGGEKALKKFVLKNLSYPDMASAFDVEGTVVMTFVVEKDGSLSDISAHDCTIDRFNTTKFSQETEARQKELKEQFALLFAKEGARVIRKMPKWTPGKLDGKPISVKYHLPIRFYDPNK